jgi:hypothetical protein
LSGRATALFAVAAVGTAAFRNDGIVIVLAASVGLMMLLRPGRRANRRARRRVAVTAGLVTAGLALANIVVFPALGVSKYSNAEMLSLPLQQTARHLKSHPDDVPDGERAVLQSLLKDGRRVDDLAEKYKPTVSDPVKNSFASFDAAGMRAYLGVWWAMVKRHPSTAVAATAANTAGYFVPQRKGEIPPISYPRQIHLKDGYWEDMKAQLSTPEADFDPSYPDGLAGARAGLIRVAKAALGLPVLWVLFTPALYTWALAACAALLAWRRAWRALWPFVPAGLVFLVCLASPVNGNMRYTLPYVVTVPLLVAYTVYTLRPAKTAPIRDHEHHPSATRRPSRPGAESRSPQPL